jgi:hypothetical protein
MKSFALSFVCLLILSGAVVNVEAAPGDPRFISGVLEWPRAITNEPFVIVRGDDGVLYYIGIATVRRDGIGSGPRMSVLGIEGRSAHEITAVGVGSGVTPEAALAVLQGIRPTVAPPAGSVGVAAPPASPPVSSAASSIAPAAGVTVAPLAAPPVSSPAPPVVAPAAPAAPSAPAAAPTAPASTAPMISGPTAAAPTAVPPAAAPHAAPAHVVPAANGRVAVAPSPTPGVPAVAPAAAPAPAAVAPAVAPAPTAAVVAAPVGLAPLIPVDDRRWTELTGEVEALVGRTLLLKVDGGRVTVDVSGLSANMERLVTPGSKVKVYGVPVEMRFKAMGFIDPDARGTRTR